MTKKRKKDIELDRETLQKLREYAAEKAAARVLTSQCRHAYLQLSNAADHLDAILARTENQNKYTTVLEVPNATVASKADVIRDRMHRWLLDGVAAEGNFVRQAETGLPDRDARDVLTPHRVFDMSRLISGKDDIVAWCRNAVWEMAAGLPNGATVARPVLHLSENACMVKIWLSLRVLPLV